MSKPGILKRFLLGTVFVAIVSLLVMLYYSASFIQFKTKFVSSLDWSESTEISARELQTNSTFPGNSSTNSSIAFDNIPVLDVHNEIDRGDVENLLKNAPKVDPTGSVIQQNKMTQNSVDLSDVKNDAKVANARSEELCPEVGPSLVGPLAVDQTVPKMEDLEKDFSSEFGGWVNKGGTWAPTKCKARLKMVLVIPYRNRYEQLAIFLHHIHPILKRQNIDYRIVVVEQVGDTPFNRGMLFNIGFKEASKFDQFTCFIFHDVDLIPEDDRNEYSCPSSPRHLSVAVDKFGYRLPYTNIFGGAGSFSREHYELINGFSNHFWGWGGEDDDLYNRINAKGLKLTRPSMQIGRYKMIKVFHSSGVSDPERFDKLRDSGERMGHDGLNSLKYVVKQVTEHLLYTLVSVDINRSTLDSR